MNTRRKIVTAFVAVVLSASLATIAGANGTMMRWFKMGEDSNESGANNNLVSSTWDTTNAIYYPIIDMNLSAVNGPVYRTISGRPDGGGGVGIEFNSATSQYLTGEELNWPADSVLAEENSGPVDLKGIEDRSLQFWARPTATTTQTLVMDTNRHGVRINSAGKFSMRFADVDYDSTISALANTWYHIELVRPAGESSRSRLFVNGVAAAISNPVDYPSDHNTPLTVGASTTGSSEFFKGIIDDLRMSVFGITTSDAHVNYGTYNFTTDNAFVASPVSGLKGIAGDVNNNGSLDAADRSAFIAGWMHKKVLNGLQIGDMFTRSEGDLNLDGVTNIQDLLLMQLALTGNGMGTITAEELAGIPEPTTALLAAFAVLPFATGRRRRIGI